MADEIRPGIDPVPPIANALAHQAGYLEATVAGGAAQIPAAPLAQQARHIRAVIDAVAGVERELLAARAEIARLRAELKEAYAGQEAMP